MLNNYLIEKEKEMNMKKATVTSVEIINALEKEHTLPKSSLQSNTKPSSPNRKGHSWMSFLCL